MKYILLTFFLFASLAMQAAITTPYPGEIEIKQINSAEKERLRLCQGQKKYDKQPTGFYVAPGDTVVVNVEILTPADNNVMPTLTVGTLGFNVDGRDTGTTTTLVSGINKITNHSGGLIWLAFTQDAGAEPKGVARITFTAESDHVRAPRFIKGTTIDAEFKEMLTAYTTPDVLYQSDYVVVVATKEAANEYSKDNNKIYWLNSIHTLLELEDQISGLDNTDPNPIHHRLAAGEIRHLLTENTSVSPHASSVGYTGYPHSSRNRYLTEIGMPGNNTWMLGHEIGHQHQQSAYQINKATESTVNIYSYVVERNIQGAGYNRTTAQRWIQTKNTYLKLPFSQRVYDMPGMATDDDFDNFLGFNRDELRFMVWEQLFIIFGDDFYKTLHRVVREEKVIGGGADERRAYLILKASQVTGYDLTEFFNLWGIRVTDAIIKADLRAKMAYYKSNGDIFDLSAIGRTPEDLLAVTGQNRPSWTPVALRGIRSSVSALPEKLDRTDWEIWTSYDDNFGAPTDATVGGDQSSYIIDGSTTTAFAFVKPGKAYNGITVPEGQEVSFTIDMKTVKSFNYVSYTHRFSGNTYEQLRARKLSVYGYNSGAPTPLKEHYEVNYENNANTVTIEFPVASYRYIKVVIEDWNHDTGSTVQIADFNVGTQAPDIQYPTPAPLQFRVNVTADEGILTSQTGTDMADEDSNYTLNFSPAAGKELDSVSVDGVKKSVIKTDGVYRLIVKVTNHLDINIVSKTISGVKNVSSDAEVKVYPNPVQVGQPFAIEFNGEMVDAAVIYNLLGAKVSETQAKGNVARVSIAQSGVYIVEVLQDRRKYTQKIMVQ